MIVLAVNGGPLPGVLLAGTSYSVSVELDGRSPISTEWTLLSGTTVVERGTGYTFQLRIANPGSYALNIKAIGTSGHGEESVTILAVSSRRTESPVLSVRWSRLQASPGQAVTAAITYADPEGSTSTSLSWVLFWNSNQQAAGTASEVQIAAAQHGIYRLIVEAKDSTGDVITADSTLRVGGHYEVLPAIVPPHEETTFQYLGCLYSDVCNTDAVVVSYLPYEVATFLQDIVLLPGTTHVRFVLDDTTEVDDEVVVRTNMGNWALVGPPLGLTSEALVYDYSLDRPYIPVPADRRLAYTIDVLNTHGYTVSASAFRVKVECYYAADPIYQYSRCAYSEFVGGAGERQRRLIAVVQNMAVDLDAVHGKHRGGTDETVIYTTQIPDRIPVVASAHGTPCPQLPDSGVMYTEANLVAVYDPDVHSGAPVLEAKGVYGLSGLRPFTMSLSIPKEVPIVQRVRHIWGTMAVYMAGGGINEDATVTARVKLNAAPGYIDYVVPTSDFYNPETDVFEKIGEVIVNVADYGFDIGGLAINFTINE